MQSHMMYIEKLSLYLNKLGLADQKYFQLYMAKYLLQHQVEMQKKGNNFL